LFAKSIAAMFLFDFLYPRWTFYG